MAGPMTVIVASIVTFGFIVRTPDALVVDDYYKDGRAIHRTLKRDLMARTLGLSAKLQMHEDVLKLTMTSAQPYAWPEQLELLLSHPVDAAKDQRFMMRRAWFKPAEAQYYADSPTATDKMRYQFILQDRSGEWRLLSLSRGEAQREVELQPSTH